MTDKEINKLAQAISRIVTKDVIEGLADEYYSDSKVEPMHETELMIMELDRLKKLLSRYVDNEEYEKAMIIKRKIEILEKRYKL